MKMDAGMDGWINGSMDRRKDGCMNKNGWIDGRKDGRMNRCTHG